MKTVSPSITLTLFTVIFSAITSSTFAQCSIDILLGPSCVGICNGSAFASVANATPPYTYLWNPSVQTSEIATGLCAGNYTCTITDANSNTCSSSVSIPSPPLLVAIADAQAASCPTCCDGSVHGGNSYGGAVPYRFKLNGTVFQYSSDFYNVCQGPDTLCIEDAYGCISCSPFAIEYSATGVKEIREDYPVNFSPNPFSSQLTLTISTNEQTTLSLYNFLGQQFLQQTFTNSTVINTAQLANGIYFYELRNSKKVIGNGKVVKQ